MSFFSNIGRQLVERRLWPVAILLVAALAAVPVVLAKDPATPPATAVAEAEGENVLAEAPIVTPASIDAVNSRKVLGKAKNPFGMPKPPKTAPSDKPSASVLPQDEKDPGKGTGSTGSTPPSSGGTTSPVAPVAPTTPTTPAEPAKTYDKYDLTVRFGESAGAPSKMTLKRLQPLPNDEKLPALIYLGVSGNGKEAIFLLEQGVEVVGDGECDPTPDACETLRLAAGETEFLDVVDETGATTAQYQLDLVKIHKGKTASASKATASSQAGRELLADRGRVPFRFDADSGTLERRPGVVADVARTTASLG
jgi:hypothetical protein